MAAWVILGFGCYLRPSENMKLRRRDLIPPVPGVTPHWAIVINAVESQEVSKTGTSDDSVSWDPPGLQWFRRVLQDLRGAGPMDDHLWPFDYPMLVAAVRRVKVELNMNFVPYQLRHARPSHDRLLGTRTLLEIQQRGRWRAFQSILRYEKSSGALSEYHRLCDDQRDYFDQLARNLQSLVIDALAVPPPPWPFARCADKALPS